MVRGTAVGHLVVYKIYAESFRDGKHLKQIQGEAPAKPSRGVLKSIMTDFHGVFPTSSIRSIHPAKFAKRTGAAVRRFIAAGVHGLTPLGRPASSPISTRTSARHWCGPRSQRRRPRARHPGVASTSIAMRGAARKTIKSSAPTAILASRAYFPLADAQVESYFRAIADAVDIPS